MLSKIERLTKYATMKVLQVQAILDNPGSQRGEESASVAAITGLVLLIILVIMAIFRNALVAAFERIAALLSF